jgi:hypothetical protein
VVRIIDGVSFGIGFHLLIKPTFSKNDSPF